MKLNYLYNKLLILPCIFAVLISSAGCSYSKSNKEEIQRRTASYLEFFDTVSQIIGYENDETVFNDVCSQVYSILEEYHRLTDIYHSYSGINNLYTVNKNAGVQPVKVDRKLIDMLLFAEDMSELTNGMFDITIGSVLSIWHEHREDADYDPASASLPSYEELSQAKLHSGADKLIIDADASTVYLTDPLASLDVGGIAKGYTTEIIAKYLQSQGITGYALNIGGNIRLIGKRGDGNGWTAGIQNPDLDPDKPYLFKVEISDTSLVTSGDYQRYYYVDGVKYHHIIHPETLMPVNNFRAVSILCNDSGVADCLSTALFNMSLDDGKALVESLDSVDALWILPDGTVKMTDNFKDKVVGE